MIVNLFKMNTTFLCVCVDTNIFVLFYFLLSISFIYGRVSYIITN